MTTKVLVHGVPETSAIWEPMLGELAALGHRDVISLSPPGFGAPLPADFVPDLDGYRDWLAGELARIGTPVDLVGHDFSGGHTINVAMTQPDLLRSWVTDVIGTLEPDYVWHPQAQTWQTPEAGEADIAQFVGAPVAGRAAAMVQWGIPGPVAGKVAAEQNEAMGRAILSLYRSAAQPVVAELGRQLPAAAARPGLALLATEDDAVGSTEQRQRAAARAGAHTAALNGLGHWWMLQDPARSARVLADFWASLPA
ncbi:MAG: alpha/beta hydrolase [Actinomycetota bacterium]|nr:alpha/beta hydrolase [Actinomycetota bacterium]